MSCARCEQDPQPSHFGSPRRCAFRSDGQFTFDNWNCATINELYEVAGDENRRRVYGADESLDVFVNNVDVDGGFLVLTRYKTRGTTSNATYVGDFYPARPVTFALVERTIDFHRKVKLT